MWKSLLLGLCVLLSVSLALFVGFSWTWGSTAVTLPNPNGYDDLLAAASSFAPNAWQTGVEDVSSEELQEHLEQNADVLPLIDLALSRECHIHPCDSSAAWQSQMDHAGIFRELARLLIAQGQLAERHEDWQGALDAYTKTMRLGPKISRGGPIVAQLIGIAVQSMGYRHATAIRKNLSKDQRQALADTAVEMSTSQIPVADATATENEWSRHSPAGPFALFVLRISGQYNRLMQPSIDAYDAAHRRIRTQYAMLRIDHALYAYVQDHGSPPESLQALTPDYLTTLPKNPRPDATFDYVPSPSGYTLTSHDPEGDKKLDIELASSPLP